MENDIKQLNKKLHYFQMVYWVAIFSILYLSIEMGYNSIVRRTSTAPCNYCPSTMRPEFLTLRRYFTSWRSLGSAAKELIRRACIHLKLFRDKHL